MPNITVTVDDEHADSMGQVAATLRACGMQISQVLEAVGVITGSVPEDGVAELRNIHGVKSVDPAVDITIPSPDSPLQ